MSETLPNAPPSRRSGRDRIERARRALEQAFELAVAQVDAEDALPRRGDSTLKPASASVDAMASLSSPAAIRGR